MTQRRLGRAPWTTSGPLDDAQRRLRDQIREGWGGGEVGLSPIDEAGQLVGPFDLMAVSPGVGGAILAAATSFREAELTAPERELVILVVAVAEDSAFMWAWHAPAAAEAGLPQRAIDAVRTCSVPSGDETWHAVYDVAHRLSSRRDLDDDEFDAAVEELGWRRLQEVVWLVGLYQALGMAMRVARTPLPTNGQDDDDD
jgi:hypothetical protein